MAGKTKSQKKKALDMRSKMYLVLALCSVMLLVSVGISLVLIGGIDLGGADAQSVSTVDSASMVVESGYNKEENTIDTQAYTSTILEQAADAGDSYVDETLFLGDSNTARMYRMFDYCSYDNAIGSVGMTAKSLATFACVQVSTSSGYITMPQAVAKLQPRRVILTFGTNDLTQYTLAVERGNAAVAHLYAPEHPAVLRLIAMTAQAAAEWHIPCGMCGEAAGDPKLAPAFVGMGVNELSMSPRRVPAVRKHP